MRISTSQMNLRGAEAIIERQNSASKTQLQLSTGKRVLTPADDPAAAAAIVTLNQSLATMNQYQRNSDFALARLQQEETALVSVEGVLGQVREYTLQGINGTQTAETRKSIADTLELLLNDLVGLANTKDANGSYLFAGFQDKSQPFSENPDGTFSYLGDDGRRMVQISDTRQVASHDSGYDVFMDVVSGNRTFEIASDANNLGSGVIDPGWVTNAAMYDKDTYRIVFPATTSAASTMTFNDAIGTDDSLNYTLKINGTTVYNVNEAGTAISSLDDLAAQINLSVDTTGVRAIVDQGALYLAAEAGTQSISVTEEISGGTANDGDKLTGYFGSALNFDSMPSNTITYDDSTAERYLVLDSDNNLEASGAYNTGARIDFAGIYTNIKGKPSVHDSFEITPSVKQDIFTTVRHLADTIRNGAGTDADWAQFHNKINRELTSLDRGMEQIDQTRASVGARLKTIDVQTDLNIDFSISVQERRSELEDLDFVEAITRFNMERTALEAAQQSYVKMQGLNLFSML